MPCSSTNLRSMFVACKYAIPEMRKRGGGVIVNTASALAHGSQTYASAYSAAKAGVLGLTRTIAIDYARREHPVQLDLTGNDGLPDRPDRGVADATRAMRHLAGGRVG